MSYPKIRLRHCWCYHQQYFSTPCCWFGEPNLSVVRHAATRTYRTAWVYITGKAWEEHTACEGKAFEETVILLSQQHERETIKAKGFQEHRTFEGKAFEELACDNRGTKKVKTTEIRE